MLLRAGAANPRLPSRRSRLRAPDGDLVTMSTALRISLVAGRDGRRPAGAHAARVGPGLSPHKEQRARVRRERQPVWQPGDWQVSVSSRNLVSNDHYNGKVEQVERQTLQNYVNNKQNLLDFGVSASDDAASQPVVRHAGDRALRWALRDPAFPLPAARREIPQVGKGIGDISVTGRFWIFDPGTHPDWNVATGAGSSCRRAMPGTRTPSSAASTRVERLRYVDQSVQPGDGGWGLLMEAHGFWRVRRAFLFASGSYLANPKDTNDTPSIIAVLGSRPPTARRIRRAGRELRARPISGTTGRHRPVWKGLRRRSPGVSRTAAIRPVRRAATAGAGPAPRCS